MTREFQNIKFLVEDRVARITLARPPLNVLNIAMMREIGEALNQCTQERDIVAIVFVGAPDTRAFSAGVSVEEHAPETVFQMLDSFHSIFRQLIQLARPVVGIVHGLAVGGGCELVAACDIVIAADNARFGQPEVKLGVFPPVAAVLLPRIIGEKRARELILSGELIDAAEALRLGLVNYVCPAAELGSKAGVVLSKLRELSASSLAMARAALDLGRDGSFESSLRAVENLYLHELMKTEDAQEGVRSFMEKRKAAWRNK
jgi:cyclohexa-1,5-dienecarbonyl-CoA hydratase